MSAGRSAPRHRQAGRWVASDSVTAAPRDAVDDAGRCARSGVEQQARSERITRMRHEDQLRSHQSDRAMAWTKLVVFAMIVGFGLLLVRVGQMKLRPDAQLAQAVSPRLSSLSELAKRGDLLDARHRVLATSTVAYRLFVDPTVVSDAQTIAVDIAEVIDADPVEIDQRILARPGRRYVVIDHELDDWQAHAIRQANLTGVGLQAHLVRHYPHGETGAGVIGMVGFEHTGLGGMEHLFEATLAPRDGRLTYLRDANRRALWIDPEAHRPAEDGGNVQLSIDLVIQQFIEQRIEEAVKEFNAGGGRAIVLDCRTGEIRAMCDVLNPRPDWDEVTTDPGRDIHRALGRNRCVTDPYEPGSTFKPFVWAVATELGRADPEEILPTPSAPAYRTTPVPDGLRDSEPASRNAPDTQRRSRQSARCSVPAQPNTRAAAPQQSPHAPNAAVEYADPAPRTTPPPPRSHPSSRRRTTPPRNPRSSAAKYFQDSTPASLER